MKQKVWVPGERGLKYEKKKNLSLFYANYFKLKP